MPDDDVLTLLQGFLAELKHMQERLDSLIKQEILKKEKDMGMGSSKLNGPVRQDELGIQVGLGLELMGDTGLRMGRNSVSQPIKPN